MKRVAIIADSHFDSGSRWDETLRIHNWIADDIAARGVDLIAHGGDIFERKSSAAERNAVAAWLLRCAETADVLLVRGNHDHVEATGAGDLAIFRELRGKHRIVVEEAAGCHALGGIAVAALAWPRKAHLLASMNGGHEEGEQLASEALRNVLRGLGVQLDEMSGPRLLVCHAMIDGANTDHDQPIVGADMAVSLADLALARADFVAVGHVHAQNDWQWSGVPILYPGAPRSCNYGEPGPKGYVIATFDDAGAVTWERIPTPATPMLLIEAAWCAESCALEITSKAYPHPNRVRGAEIRLRYDVESDHRDAAKRAAKALVERMLADGAVNVKLEEQVIATVRARVPEIAAARTLPEQLAAMWKARKDEPEPARAARLMSKLMTLEAEVGT
jgi:DNA repair exonuclease SbcCD nuclease subunit